MSDPIDLMTYDGELEYVELQHPLPPLVTPARIIARDCVPLPIAVAVRKPAREGESDEPWDDVMMCGPDGVVRNYRTKAHIRPKRKRVTVEVYVYLLDDGATITTLAPIQTASGLRKRVGAKVVTVEVVEGEGV